MKNQRNRVKRLIEQTQAPESYHRTDESTGWSIVGGGPGASGVLFVPQIATEEEWLSHRKV